MKKTLTILIFGLITTSAFSQSIVPEKFSSVSTISTPNIDKIDQINTNMIEITESDWIKYQFNKLEEYDTDYQYNAYGVIVINDFKILLIQRQYREESNHWAVFINDDKKFISYLNIAYDNPKGFLYIESEIESDMIKIKETNKLAVPVYSEISYQVNNSGFIKK